MTSSKEVINIDWADVISSIIKQYVATILQ